MHSPPSAMQWYYSKNFTQLGPVSVDELRAKLASAEVSSTDLAWREGMSDWCPVSSIDELRTPSNGQVAGSAMIEGSPYAPPLAPAGAPSYAVPPPTSGLAIASMVCGILGLMTCLLPGIAAVICGHMALKQMADPSLRVGGRGMAVAGLITGYLSVTGLVGILLVMVLAALSA